MIPRFAALLVLAVSLSACGSAEPSYFPSLPGVRDTTSGSVPVGGRGLIGVADLEAHAGDTVTLLSLDVPGAEAASVHAYVIRRSDTGGGGVGFIGDDNFGGYSFEAVAHTLPGYSLAHSDGVAQVVVALQSSTLGMVRFTHVVLHFKVNDRELQEVFFGGANVCFGDPAQPACAPASPSG